MKRFASGFTLIEVLVALAIVAFGMAAVMAAMTSAADNAYFLRDKTFAQWIAINQITVQRLKQALPSKGKTEGEIEDFVGRHWVWQQDVQPLQLKGMWRIDVSVRPLRDGESKGEALSKKTGWYATESGVIGDAVTRDWLDVQTVWDMKNGFGGGPGRRGTDDDDGAPSTGAPAQPGKNP